MSFLPDDYKAPKANSHYMKIVDGENRIRIMSKPVFGWEDWKDNKPMRFRMDDKPLKPVDPKKPIKHFWAFIVFNYNEEQVQILQISQATVRKSIEALCRDKDWGAPFAYDIKIVKKGEKVDTEYTVNPVPHKPIDPYLITSFNERRANLDALFTNADPFSMEWTSEHWTPLADKEEVKSPEPKIVPIKEEKITADQVRNLTEMFSDLPTAFVDQVHEFMKKQKISTYSDMSVSTYDRIMKQAIVEKTKPTNGGK